MRTTMFHMVARSQWSGRLQRPSTIASTPLPVMCGAMEFYCTRSGPWASNHSTTAQTVRSVIEWADFRFQLTLRLLRISGLSPTHRLFRKYWKDTDCLLLLVVLSRCTSWWLSVGKHVSWSMVVLHMYRDAPEIKRIPRQNVHKWHTWKVCCRLLWALSVIVKYFHDQQHY